MEDDTPKFNFKNRETVTFRVVEVDQPRKTSTGGWKLRSIDELNITDRQFDTSEGIASYQHCYMGLFDSILEDELECPGVGYWSVDVTGEYHRGDWSRGEDDDIEFFWGIVRPASEDEIRSI